MTVNFHAQSLPGCLAPHRSRTLGVQFWNAILIGKKNYFPEFFWYSFIASSPYMMKIQAMVCSWMRKVCHGNIFIFLDYSCILCYFMSHICVSMCVLMNIHVNDYGWCVMTAKSLAEFIFLLCYFIRSETRHNLSFKKGEVLITDTTWKLSTTPYPGDLPEIFRINWYPQVRWILGQTCWFWSVLSFILWCNKTI